MSIDASAVSAAATSCRSVVALSPGPFGDVATYLPYQRIIGVRVTADQIEVRVVAVWGPPLAQVGEEVRAAVRPAVGALPVEVFIDDIMFPSHMTEAMDAHKSAARPHGKEGL